LWQHGEEIEALNLKVCVVTFEREFFVSAYIRETGVHWPILLDKDRQLYTAYGMMRGRVTDVLGLRSWWAYAKLMARGRRLRRTEADVYQLGGDVLADPEGIVRFHHIGRGPADRPTITTLLDVARS